MKKNKNKKKRVLVVEDDKSLSESIEAMLKGYDAALEFCVVENAGEAWPHLFPENPKDRPDAVILDIMMPYGTAADSLDSESDPDCIETGVRLIRKLREQEKESNHQSGRLPTWVSVVTARSNPKLIEELNTILDGRGKLYFKPYKPTVLEHDLMHVSGIECNVPEVLLPRGYKPPAIEVS